MQKVLNFSARVVTGARRGDHVTPILEALGWHAVADLVTRRDCIGVYRALKDPRAPAAIRALFTPRADISARTPQGDRPLPAPRGGWGLELQPSAAPASAGWGSGAPPAPAVLFVCLFLFVSTDAGLPSCITKRSSVRCGASELRFVI